MAIHPLSAPTDNGSPAAGAPGGGVDVAAWADGALVSLEALVLSGSSSPVAASASSVAGTEDAPAPTAPRRAAASTAGASLARPAPRWPDGCLKGTEGSRRRKRWENDRLAGNPYLQAPLPADWDVRPTHPVRSVPYFLAPLWEAGLSARQAERAGRPAGAAAMPPAVPKAVRDRLKRARGAKAVLHDLEEELRRFLLTCEERQQQLRAHGQLDLDSEDDDGIVFVGRAATTADADADADADSDALQRDKLLSDSAADDRRAAFTRWLVHSIGAYYGLRTWSETVDGPPARRKAYVTVTGLLSSSTAVSLEPPSLPRPLWQIV